MLAGSLGAVGSNPTAFAYLTFSDSKILLLNDLPKTEGDTGMFAFAKNQCYHGDMESMTSNEFKLLLKLIVKLLKEGKTQEVIALLEETIKDA